MKLAPMYDNVVIQIEQKKKESTGGIFLGTEVGETATIGQVLEVGPGVLLESGELCPLPLKVGDLVVLPPHLGSTEMSIDGEQLVILRAREVLAVISNR